MMAARKDQRYTAQRAAAVTGLTITMTPREDGCVSHALRSAASGVSSWQIKPSASTAQGQFSSPFHTVG